MMTPYQDFTIRFKILISKNPVLITTTLSNIFTMRLIGNKTHGDLAEIGIAEFINQYMYDFKATHVGKDLFRAKTQEEDIQIINEITKEEFPLSLKAYGEGPLQLSTDRRSLLFPSLEAKGEQIEGEVGLSEVWSDPAFKDWGEMNILPLIYREREHTCNIFLFDYERAKKETKKIIYESKGQGRKHPVYRFYNDNEETICEVRYGGQSANALQRGLWTNTKNATAYFESLTGGWILYRDEPLLVELFSFALLSTANGHRDALDILKRDIQRQKAGLKV